MSKLDTNYYEKYVGDFAKRFYTKFEEDNIAKIVKFDLKRMTDDSLFAHFTVEQDGNTWEWDVEDCVIITNEPDIIDDERVANIKHPEYMGYNPFEGDSEHICNFSIDDIKKCNGKLI